MTQRVIVILAEVEGQTNIDWYCSETSAIEEMAELGLLGCNFKTFRMTLEGTADTFDQQILTKAKQRGISVCQ